MDPITVEILSAATSKAMAGLNQDAWDKVLTRMRRLRESQTDGPAVETSPRTGEDESSSMGQAETGLKVEERESHPPAAAITESQETLHNLLQNFYKKVGRRADVSFYAAIAAAVTGFAIVTAGLLIGIYNSDDTALAIAATGAGTFSQVLAFFFFRNRQEERNMMASALAGLRKDAEADVRALRALELVEQVADPFLRDSLTVAISLELSGASTDLGNIHRLIANASSDGSSPERSE